MKRREFIKSVIAAAAAAGIPFDEISKFADSKKKELNFYEQVAIGQTPEYEVVNKAYEIKDKPSHIDIDGEYFLVDLNMHCNEQEMWIDIDGARLAQWINTEQMTLYSPLPFPLVASPKEINAPEGTLIAATFVKVI